MGKPSKLKIVITEVESRIEGYQQEKEALETLIANEMSMLEMLRKADASTKGPGSLKPKGKDVDNDILKKLKGE